MCQGFGQGQLWSQGCCQTQPWADLRSDSSPSSHLGMHDCNHSPLSGLSERSHSRTAHSGNPGRAISKWICLQGQDITGLVGPRALSHLPLPGLRDTEWPGRTQVLQRGPVTWYLDGAHTTSSVQACVHWYCQSLERSRRTDG